MLTLMSFFGPVLEPQLDVRVTVEVAGVPPTVNVPDEILVAKRVVPPNARLAQRGHIWDSIRSDFVQGVSQAPKRPTARSRLSGQAHWTLLARVPSISTSSLKFCRPQPASSSAAVRTTAVNQKAEPVVKLKKRRRA
jgi:hypothetical protein